MKQFFLLFLGALCSGLNAQTTFTKITDPNNPAVTFSNNGTPYKGVAWVDFDGDGRTDLAVSPRFLFRNLGNGNFAQLTSLPYTPSTEICSASSWGDYDNDGYTDALTSNVQAGLWHNEGDDTFTSQNNLLDSIAAYPAWDCVFADADNNGLLDATFIHAANFHTLGPFPCKMYLQESAGDFTPVNGYEFTDQNAPYTIPVWADYDLDGDQDLFIGAGPAGTPGPDFCYRNLLKETGTFALQRLTAAPFDALQDGQTYNFPDFDNDGDLDMCLTNYAGAPGRFWRQEADGSYTPMATPFSVAGTYLANCWGDVDNDGFLDVLITNDGINGPLLYRNDGNGGFLAGQTIVSTDAMFVSGIALADYDNDGDLDFYTNGPTIARSLMRNDLQNANHWAAFILEGVNSNRSAIGADIRVKTNGIWQIRQVSAHNSFQSQNDLRQHFGLGAAAVMDSIVVRWPSGLVQAFTGKAANTFYRIVEGQNITTAIETPASETVLKVTPNPFRDVFQVELPAGLAIETIDLLDISGKRYDVNTGPGSSSRAVRPVKDLPAGVYFIRAKGKDGIIATGQVVKL